MAPEPGESPAPPQPPEQSDADPLERLGATLDALRREADGLAEEMAAEAGTASEMRLALADSIVPLSAKDGIGTPRELYLESLRRRRLRLQREGEALAEQLARFAAEAERLRAQRAALTETVTQLRQRGVVALDRLDEIHALRAHTLAWAQSSMQQRRRLMEWSERLAVHTHRLRNFPPPAEY